ncbi:reducing type I polyketide synthase [Zopfia rhizophila CBS 207.26]|uniref:Reducing type I polyketide synthase n=1 Tax=Zopfia rhizophila CBS 207.26 TaxID=1314779 RepID=A0A6A6DBZ7_9PEZI|nr:reducing type I polyketide synthase [Zopfia rhizophila CBS 207.26]
MAFDFPQGANNPDAFWKILEERRCTATEYPKDRFNIDAFWKPDSKAPNAIKCREAHFLEGDVGNFDAGFFSMAPHEVASMDPQQRGIMETTYHALENAGLPLNEVSGSNTSVHIGCFTNDFSHMQLRDTQNIPKYSASGSANSILANRISWFYNLRGESMYVDTACSSSLVAMALACQGLSLGSSGMAIVGAANIILGPEFNIALSKLNFLSPSGRCKSFDASGDGYGRGEGFATLVLKPVSKAIADGNPIRAVIRSFGMNQDGYTSGGITQPSKEMQVQLIRETYEKAGLSMADTRFFEAHGTGTAVGDPIEARAIGESFWKYRKDDEPMYIGALKSNFGHLEGTSGLASVVKTILAVERGMIPPNTNFETLNPQIDADFLKLSFPTKCIPWPNGNVRRASVNSFGFGGSNAHIVIEAAEDYLRNITAESGADIVGETETLNSCPKLLVLSATDEDGNSRQAKSLAMFFSQYGQNKVSEEGLLEDVLSALNTRRTAHGWKSYAILKSLSDFSRLEDLLSKPVRQGQVKNPKLGFVFTGQGAQWPRMGIELLGWPIVRASIARSQDYLQMFGYKWDLVNELSAHKDSSNMHDPEFSQVATTAVQIALVDLAEYLDISPTVVVGHSSGEIAASYCAGLLSHESAIKVSYFRGLLSSRLSKDRTLEPYGMVSVGIPAMNALNELAEIETINPQQFEASQLSVSSINTPGNITISGPEKYLDIIVEHFKRKNMKLVSCEYLAMLSKLRAREKPNNVQMISTASPGRVTETIVCTGEYWVRNMVSPVQFAEAMQFCTTSSKEDGMVKKIDQSHKWDINVQGWLEVGPHSALKGPSREIFKAQGESDMFYTSFLQRWDAADVTTLGAVGMLHCRNFSVDLVKVAALNATANHRPRVILDLPKYPFNHSTVHWEESARSRALRFQANGYHSLLGAPSIDWNPLDAKWRWSMKKEDMPWVADHQVNGKMLYPASGMIVMAIEAAKQLLTDRNANPLGFELEDVSFLAPLVLADSPGKTETQLSMVPVSGAGSRDAQYKFRIFVMRSDDVWQEVCNGFIHADYGRTAQDVCTQPEEEIKLLAAQKRFKSALSSCQKSITASDMYQKVAVMSGLQYGPTFQGLSDIHYDTEGRAYAKILPYAPTTQHCSYTVHPTTLDSIFQLGIPSLSKGLTVSLPTFVPSRLTRLWIAASGAGKEESGLEVANIQSSLLSRRSAKGSITVFSETHLELRVVVEEFEVTEMARDDTSAISEAKGNALCYEMDWKPDHSILSTAEISQYCSEQREHYQEPEQYYEDSKLMLLCFAAQALQEMESSGQVPIASMTNYAGWLQARIDAYLGSEEDTLDLIAQLDKYTLIHNLETLREITERVEPYSSRGRVNATVGHNLKDILLGQVDPLQLLFEDNNFLADFYEELNTAGKAFDMLNAYIDLLVHKDPSLKFLEIGAGTGATTAGILSVIARPDCGTRYSSYTFTDISAAFFPKARDRFSTFGDCISYRVLNIEEDPATQSFLPEEQYDIVVAAQVLHATGSLTTTLSNLRMLLKPNGKLILIEMTTPNKIETGFIFGTLAGWWHSSEQWRQDNASAVFPEDQWDALLKDSGFTGTEQVFRDWDSDQCHGWSIMISSARPNNVADQILATKFTQTTPTLVVNKDSSFEIQVANDLRRLLAGDVHLIEIMTFDDIPLLDDLSSRHLVLLGGLEKGFLSEIGPDTFKALQKVLTTSKSVLWASCTHPRSAAESAPYWAMTEGLCRTCRSEEVNIPIVTLILEESTCESSDKAASRIAKTFSVFQYGINTGSVEPEYRESSGLLCINRLTQATYLDTHISTRAQKGVSMQEFNCGTPMKLDIRIPGFLDTLQWVEDESVYEPLQPHQVEIRVHTIGVNFKECLILLGRVNTDNLGSECSGYVHRVGTAVSAEHLQVGDRVALGALETYRNYVRAWDFQVVKIPDAISFADAAAIPTAFCTAYYSLINVARLRKNEKVLIHAAAGGTGQAAVQVAQHVGAEVFAAVGSTEKKKLLMDRYAIPEDHIFYSRDSSFADGIRRITHGRGVDVVLNSLSGKLLVASWELIAHFGRFVEIGRKDIDSRQHLPMHPFLRNATFTGVDLATIVENREQIDKYALQEIFDFVEQGIFQPSYPVQSYPIEQIEQAFRSLQSGKSSGKIVIELSDKALVPFQEGPNSRYRFSADATYVIAGGLGGIGRQIISWLARRGAKFILILSRNGPETSKEKMGVIAELEAKGVKVQYSACDISDRQALERSIRDASATMPGIKGCFQAAMVLRDRPFGSMTYEEWSEAIAPKVQGSWNLHTVLPSGMDFFIMLSSTSGILGNPGQSNYAAGNNFQDALAQYRTLLGEKAVALDLGMILGEGFVAENKDIKERLLRLNLLEPLKQEEIFAIFDFYCNPETRINSVKASQVITGIILPASVRQKGQEVPNTLRRSLFALLHQIRPSGDVSEAGPTKAQDFSAVFKQASTIQEAAALVAEALKNKLCKILGVEPDDRSVHDRMESFGVDSLLALELRNWLLRDVRADLAVFEILGDSKLLDIGLLAARKSEFSSTSS